MTQTLERPSPRTVTRDLIVEFAFILLGVAIALVISSHMRSTPYNQAVRAAYGWLHGRFWIDWPGPYMEALEFNGQHYPQYPPFPALLTLPFVLIAGETANQTVVAMLCCLGAIAFAWLFLVRLGVNRLSRVFLTLFLFAGTDLWWCSELGDVWFIAHSAAVLCTFVALWELTGRRRAWLVGLMAFCAFESRAVMLLAVPLYAYLLYFDDLKRECPEAIADAMASARMRLVQFGGVLAGGAIVYMVFNFFKWGVPYDAGYGLYFHQEGWGQATGSPFRLSYLPYQIYSFFMRPPELLEWRQQAIWPYFKVDPNGVALTFTSPALIIAFFAKPPLRLKWALWGTVILIAIPNFLYYLNGWYQFGMRHALDFIPFLFVLMAFALRERIQRWSAALIVYSILAGLWGVWWWGANMRTGD